jgi:hypothetical protein
VAPPVDVSTVGHDDDFVSPDEGPDRACAEPAPRTPPGIAVLAPAGDAHPLGASLGLAIAGLRSAPVVVSTWIAGSAERPWWRAPAMPPARRLATALAARGHEARAAGRLVLVRLAVSAEDASLEARRVAAAAGHAATVLALGGPRVAEFEELLAEQDLVVVATPGGTDLALRRLAISSLTAGCTRACACEVLNGQLGRAAAASGLVLLPAARRPLSDALEALR